MRAAELPAVLPVLVWNPNATLDVVNALPVFVRGAVNRAARQLTSPGGKGTLLVRGLNALEVQCLGVAPLAGPVGIVAGSCSSGSAYR